MLTLLANHLMYFEIEYYIVTHSLVGLDIVTVLPYLQEHGLLTTNIELFSCQSLLQKGSKTFYSC